MTKFSDSGVNVCSRRVKNRTDLRMLPSSPASIMKEKIRQAQDARRQRLRTRLEEMAATGNPVHLAAPAGRRSELSSPQAGGQRKTDPDAADGDGSPRSLHVHFNEPEHGASREQDGPSIPIFAPTASVKPAGAPPWAGLRLQIDSPPALARQTEWPSAPTTSEGGLLGPDSPTTEAARQDWRDAIAREPAACLRQSPVSSQQGGASPPPASLSGSVLAGQPLQRANVQGVVQEMGRSRRAPGDTDPDEKGLSPAAFNDIANWVSPDGSVASFCEYQEKKREKEQERAKEADSDPLMLQELVAKNLETGLSTDPASPEINSGDGGGRSGDDDHSQEEDRTGHLSAEDVGTRNSEGDRKMLASNVGGSSSSVWRGHVAADDREGRAWLRIVHRRLGPSLTCLRQAKLKVSAGDLSTWQVTAQVGQMLADVETNLLAVAEVLQERISLLDAQQEQEHAVVVKGEEGEGQALDAKGKQVDGLRSQVSMLEARVLHLSQAKSALELKIEGLENTSNGGSSGLADTRKMSKFQLEMSAAKDAVR